MQAFIFETVEKVIDHHHHDAGGLIIIAEDKDAAERIISNRPDIFVSDDDWAEVVIYSVTPGQDEQVFVFPDLGCCA